MEKASDIHPLLKRIAAITRMERGTLCPLAGRPHYNHQTWQDGRNISRYVRTDEAAALQEAIDGYQRFMKLADQYANLVIRRSRAQRARAFQRTRSRTS
jgi:hypothetical protein